MKNDLASDTPVFILTIGVILATFGVFMVVLIAIEIFQNIILYLRDDVIHVKIVLSTALMAIARKVIILVYNELEPLYIFATGLVLSSPPASPITMCTKSPTPPTTDSGAR